MRHYEFLNYSSLGYQVGIYGAYCGSYILVYDGTDRDTHETDLLRVDTSIFGRHFIVVTPRIPVVTL